MIGPGLIGPGLIGMSDNWGYVTAGYALTTVTLVSYAVWIKLRTRRLCRALADNETP